MNPKGDVTLCSWYSHSRKPYRKGFYCSAILSLIGVRRDQSVTAFKIALSMVSCCLVTRFKAWTLLTYSLVLHPHSGHAACTPGSQYAHLPRKTLGPPQNGHGGSVGSYRSMSLRAWRRFPRLPNPSNWNGWFSTSSKWCFCGL